MDRDRLQQVQQSDLSENKVNQEFVDWLKTKGPNWLLVVLVAICAFLFVQQWKQRQVSYVDQAWADFAAADSPLRLVDVAEQYSDVGGLGALARLQAARIYLIAVQQGKSVQAVIVQDSSIALIDDSEPEALTDEMRADYLSQADQLFQSVLEDEITNASEATSAAHLYAVNALNGRAAVSEARGDAEKAADLYEQAAKRADAFDSKLAQICRSLAAATAENTQRVNLASNPADAAPQQGASPFATTPIQREDGLEPISVEPSLNTLING